MSCRKTLLAIPLVVSFNAMADSSLSSKYRFEHRQGNGLHQFSTSLLSDTLLQGKYSYHFKTGWELSSILRARYERELEVDQYKEFDVRELYFSKNEERYSVKLGRQQVIWGKTDGIRILDVINPLDLREFLLDKFVDSRIPLWILNTEWFFDSSSLQLLLVPQLTFDRLSQPGGRFYIGPLIPTGLQVQTLSNKTPTQSTNNWQYALRWSKQIAEWDITLNGIYDWNKDPVYFYQVNGINSIQIQPEYRRRRIIGASGDRPIGESVFRFEATYTPDEYRESSNPLSERGFMRQNLLSFAAGLDWYKNNWLISPQLFRETLMNPDQSLSKRASTSYSSLLINRKFLHDKLELRVFYLYGISDYDQWVSPSIAYQIAGQYELSLKIDVFKGNKNTLFGQFDEQDRVVSGISAYF